MLATKNLTKTIHNKTIFQDINIDLKVWEIRTIIGPSGWGKSSILACIANIDIASSWEIVLWDKKQEYRDGKLHGPELAYPDIGMVFQGLHLRPHMNVAQNITLALHEHNIFCKKSFDTIVGHMQIGHLLAKTPQMCSGGERQRIALARKFLMKPKYLLLDEVTSALDVEHIQKVSEILRDLKQDCGILLVTHQINFAKRISDHIYFVDQGKIVEEGGVEILDDPRSGRLHQFLSLQ